MHLCNCVCMLLFVCVCFLDLCVSVCSSSSAPYSGLPLFWGPLPSVVKAGFSVPGDGVKCPGCTGVGWGLGAK